MPSLVEPCWSSACISAEWADKNFGVQSRRADATSSQNCIGRAKANAGLAERGLYCLYEEFRRTFPRAGVVVFDESIVG